MPMKNAIALTLGTLWDGRLKLFAQTHGEFWSREKAEMDWTEWVRF